MMTATVNETTKQDDHLKLVKKSYWIGFLGSVIVVVCSLLAAFMINRFFPLNELTIHLMQAFSVVPGSAALFGVRGWDIQTWGGNTPAELLNQKLFTRLSAIGLFLPVMAFSLIPYNINESVLKMESNVMEKIEGEKSLEHKRNALNTSNEIP
jgi:ABC-type sulfate transport system permease component